jgi:hypothetical protein
VRHIDRVAGLIPRQGHNLYRTPSGALHNNQRGGTALRLCRLWAERTAQYQARKGRVRITWQKLPPRRQLFRTYLLLTD